MHQSRWQVFLLGLCWDLENVAEQAQQLYEKAIALTTDERSADAHNHRLLFNQALYLLTSGQFEKALSLYESTIVQRPSKDLIRDALGDIALIQRLPRMEDTVRSVERLLQEAFADSPPSQG